VNNADLTFLIERSVRDAMKWYASEINNDQAIFPVRTTRQVADVFNVTRHTVLAWHKAGLLEGNYQLVSGYVCRLVFTNRALVQFFDKNFPSLADLSVSPFHPKSSRAQRIKKMLAMKKVYNRRRQRKRKN
jgi:hypothetical protein